VEAGALDGGGEVAGFVAAEPAVAVAGDEGVNGVAEGSGDEAKDGEEAPGETEEGGDGEGGVTADEDGLIGAGVDEGVELVGVEAIGQADLTTEIGLEGGEVEAGGVIVTEEELDAGGAEGADAVEEDEMFGGKVHE
jgi:hypothetical protein